MLGEAIITAYTKFSDQSLIESLEMVVLARFQGNRDFLFNPWWLTVWVLNGIILNFISNEITIGWVDWKSSSISDFKTILVWIDRVLKFQVHHVTLLAHTWVGLGYKNDRAINCKSKHHHHHNQRYNSTRCCLERAFSLVSETDLFPINVELLKLGL